MVLSNNATTATIANSSLKLQCAKECPCGVPVIPVPDEWLEVMVSGGFKVWHIIFIVIALIVGLVVIYCCFHRCRIPRTKQEIEADLMRANLAKKFSQYMQELPSEPTTFTEALKKVQELEEKAEREAAKIESGDDVPQDSGGIQKRLGWLKGSRGDVGAKTINLVLDSCDLVGTTIAPSESSLKVAPIDLDADHRLLAPIKTTTTRTTIATTASEKSARSKAAASRAAENERSSRDLIEHSKSGSLERANELQPGMTKSNGALVRTNKMTERRRRHKPSLARTKAPRPTSKLKVAR